MPRITSRRVTLRFIPSLSSEDFKRGFRRLGHSNPELTPREFIQILPQEETDLNFLDFGGSKGGTKLRATANKIAPPS